MNSWRSDIRYKKGVDEDLDIKWGKYKMKRILTGDAWDKALTQREADILGEIWRKKRASPWKLTFREVWTYVKYSERIDDTRKRAKREAARYRKHRSREKMKAAAKLKDSSAIKRIEDIKKYNREYISKIRKEKKSDPTSK